MLQRNAISEISPDTPGFYLNTFMVCKASGGWRSGIDLKQLNHHIDAAHFRMHTIILLLITIKKRDYVFKIDLQDVYFHVLIHPHSKKYLRFAFENKVYQFRVLHFSLNTAPQVFTCLRHRVAAYLHHQGISVNSISRRLVDTSPRLPGVTSPPVSVTKHTEYGRPQTK